MNNTVNCLNDLKELKYIPANTRFIEDGEEWKNVPVELYADRYLISDDGRSYSIKWHAIMNNSKNDKGYYGVNLCKNYHLERKSLSRMVALSYIPDTPENWQELDVNHKDENPANNAVENLEWVTHQQNCNYGEHNRRISQANKGRKMTEEQRARLSESRKGRGCKAVQQYDKDGNLIAEYNSVYEAAEATGLDKGNISHCARGERPTVGGFIFKYKVSQI